MLSMITENGTLLLLMFIIHVLLVNTSFINSTKNYLCKFTFREEDGSGDKKEDNSKPKSIFEQFNIPRPTLQLNPFTGNLFYHIKL